MARDPRHPIAREVNSKFEQLGKLLDIEIPHQFKESTQYDQDHVNNNFDVVINKIKAMVGDGKD